MLKFEAFAQISLHRKPVDFRKSINGLSVIVEEEMELNVFSRSLFVFCNKQRNKLKLLYWDETGFALWYKRLEQDRFRWPKHLEEEVVVLEAHELEWLLAGYDVWKLTPHKKLEYMHIG